MILSRQVCLVLLVCFACAPFPCTADPGGSTSGGSTSGGSTSGSLSPSSGSSEGLAVSVDPRTELVAVVFRLAGSEAYVRPQSKSPYADEVAEWFEEVRDHEVVQLAKRLKATQGISYDAPMTLAVHLDSLETLELAVPLEPWPERLDRRWTEESIGEFLPALRDFAKASRFPEFFDGHAKFYKKAGKRLHDLLQDEELSSWAASYFGRAVGSDTRIFIGLLQGGHNFGCGVRREDGTLELCPVLGAWEWDRRGDAVFGELHVPTAAHEFAHSFVNPVIDAHAEGLKAAGEALLGSAPDLFRQQAYGEGRIVLYESLVRAAVLRYLLTHQGAKQASAMAAHDRKSGFVWVPDLAMLLANEYEADREKYPDLASFDLRLVAFFEERAASIQTKVSDAPKVISTTPANGDTDVDPGVALIEVVFSQPMTDGRWSVMKGNAPFPEVTGKPSFDSSRKIFRLPVKLKPNSSYAFGINGPNKTGFISKKGIPVAPVQVVFRTRPQSE